MCNNEHTPINAARSRRLLIPSLRTHRDWHTSVTGCDPGVPSESIQLSAEETASSQGTAAGKPLTQWATTRLSMASMATNRITNKLTVWILTAVRKRTSFFLDIAMVRPHLQKCQDVRAAFDEVGTGRGATQCLLHHSTERGGSSTCRAKPRVHNHGFLCVLLQCATQRRIAATCGQAERRFLWSPRRAPSPYGSVGRA